MEKDSLHNTLEDFYKEDSLQKAIRRVSLKQFRNSLWKVVWGLIIGCGIWLGILSLLDRPQILVMTFVIYLFGLLLCFLVAILIAAMLASIPLKKYDYNDRLDFLVPVLLIGIGGIGVILLVFSTIEIV